MQPWKTVDRRVVLENGKWMTVEYRTLELPDGQQITDWAWLVLPHYVNVAVVTAEGKYVCFRQVKYAVEGVSLAPVGGYLEAGEDALGGAQREVLEETGYQASEWVNLGQYAVDGNRGAGVGHMFLAKGAKQVAAVNADDLEEQEMVLLERVEVEAALRAGAFKVLPWATVMALALLQG